MSDKKAVKPVFLILAAIGIALSPCGSPARADPPPPSSPPIQFPPRIMQEMLWDFIAQVDGKIDSDLSFPMPYGTSVLVRKNAELSAQLTNNTFTVGSNPPFLMKIPAIPDPKVLSIQYDTDAAGFHTVMETPLGATGALGWLADGVIGTPSEWIGNTIADKLIRPMLPPRLQAKGYSLHGDPSPLQTIEQLRRAFNFNPLLKGLRDPEVSVSVKMPEEFTASLGNGYRLRIKKGAHLRFFARTSGKLSGLSLASLTFSNTDDGILIESEGPTLKDGMSVLTLRGFKAKDGLLLVDYTLLPEEMIDLGHTVIDYAQENLTGRPVACRTERTRMKKERQPVTARMSHAVAEAIRTLSASFTSFSGVKIDTADLAKFDLNGQTYEVTDPVR